MEPSPSWEASNCAATQELPSLLHYCWTSYNSSARTSQKTCVTCQTARSLVRYQRWAWRGLHRKHNLLYCCVIWQRTVYHEYLRGNLFTNRCLAMGVHVTVLSSHLWHCFPSSLLVRNEIYILKMEAADCSETLLNICQTTRHHIAGDNILHSQHVETSNINVCNFNAILTRCLNESWVSLMAERGQWGMQNSRECTWKTRVFHWNISSHSLFVVSFHWSLWQTVTLPTGAVSQACSASVMLSFIMPYGFQVTTVQLGTLYRSLFLRHSRVCYSLW
jgi:hypothetical protein